jgi:hypothetical protein
MRTILEKLFTYDALLLVFTAWPAMEVCLHHAHKAWHRLKKRHRR